MCLPLDYTCYIYIIIFTIIIIYYLKQLRRCGVALEDQLMFYKSVIVPITEYACPAWHTSLTKHDTDTLENIQKRAISVIFPGLKYHDALKTSKLPTLSTRRDLLCKAFLVVFSFFEKTTYCCRARRLSVRLSVRPSVRLWK